MKLNDQEMFDKVLAHSRKQKKRAVCPEGNCQYRTKDGLKCFAGALLSDEQYETIRENTGLLQNSVFEEITDNIVFLSRLKAIHDCNSPDDWEDRFRMVARDNGLNYTKEKHDSV